MFDCINHQQLLPTSEYSPGAVLPPHLSPFVREGEGDYIPPERQRELREDEEEGMETRELTHTHTHTQLFLYTCGKFLIVFVF